MLRILKYVFISLALLLALGLAAGGYVAKKAFEWVATPAETPGREVVFEIEPGQSFEAVVRGLAAQGVIADADYFIFYAKYRRFGAKMQTGEFRFNTGWAPDRVLEELERGKPILYKLTIREGLPWWETARIVEAAGYADFDDFAKAIRDPELLAKHRIPFDTAEGFLFPETYMLQRPKRRDGKVMVDLLCKSFWDRAGKVVGERSPEDLAKLMIFASIVEKETGKGPERAKVAGVYANRVRLKMLLQADPTTIYGLGPTFNGNLTRANLDDPTNPYNTYKRPGLTPGPICSPGLAAITAAARPEEHEYLYFVSRNDGTHQFSKSLDEHNAAVRKYQIRREKG